MFCFQTIDKQIISRFPVQRQTFPPAALCRQSHPGRHHAARQDSNGVLPVFNQPDPQRIRRGGGVYLVPRRPQDSHALLSPPETGPAGVGGHTLRQRDERRNRKGLH